MAISLIYTSHYDSTSHINSINPIEMVRIAETTSMFEHLLEFINNYPLTMVEQRFNPTCKTLQIDFVDRASLDLYLTDSRNLKLIIDTWLLNPIIVEECINNNCELNISIVDSGALPSALPPLTNPTQQILDLMNYLSTL